MKRKSITIRISESQKDLIDTAIQEEKELNKSKFLRECIMRQLQNIKRRNLS